MKSKTKIGCSIIGSLFLISMVCIFLFLDEKTGKSDPNKWYLFIPAGITLIILFGFLIKMIFKFILGFGELPGILKDPVKNADFVGKNGIRGKFMNFFKNPLAGGLWNLSNNINPFNFICPHSDCLKTILMENIPDTVCPYCGHKNDDYTGIFLPCPKCGRIMKYFKCPECHKDIDLFADYNEEELIRKSYE